MVLLYQEKRTEFSVRFFVPKNHIALHYLAKTWHIFADITMIWLTYAQKNIKIINSACI